MPSQFGWLHAGLEYFSLVFAASFVLGFTQITLLVPRLGGTISVIFGLPWMLAVSWISCGTILMRHRELFGDQNALLAMGAVAFSSLVLAEAALGMVTGTTRSPREFLRSLRSPGGALGLLGQVGFGMFPVIRGGQR